MIRAVVADDEPLARQKLVSFLEREPDVEVVAACAGGAETIDAVAEHAPDLLFLDVQMPEVDGFEVLQALDAGRRPEVVFVTAHDRFAVRAFELHAVDYLLKPFARERFRTSLARARERIARGGGADPRLAGLIEALRAERTLERIPVSVGKRTHFVRLDDVDWIESDGNYVRLHAGGSAHVIRATMKALEEKLDPARFVRISRGAIVNLARVTEVVARGGDYTLILGSGVRLQSGAGYARRVRRVVEPPL